MEPPFFEAPEPLHFEPPGPQPAWLGSPENVLGVPVPIELVVARTPDAAVAVRSVVAYPEGFELTCAVRLRHAADVDAWPFDLHGPRGTPFTGGELPAELLRFGVLFSDGTKATSVGRMWPAPSGPDEPPEGPVMMPRGGGGGGHRWDHQYWVWPLPPPGELAFVCEWPAHGIALTRATIDAGLIRVAAERAEVLWPAEDEPGGGVWSSAGVARGATAYGHSAARPRRDA